MDYINEAIMLNIEDTRGDVFSFPAVFEYREDFAEFIAGHCDELSYAEDLDGFINDGDHGAYIVIWKSDDEPSHYLRWHYSWSTDSFENIAPNIRGPWLGMRLQYVMPPSSDCLYPADTVIDLLGCAVPDQIMVSTAEFMDDECVYLSELDFLQNVLIDNNLPV